MQTTFFFPCNQSDFPRCSDVPVVSLTIGYPAGWEFQGNTVKSLMHDHLHEDHSTFKTTFFFLFKQCFPCFHGNKPLTKGHTSFRATFFFSLFGRWYEQHAAVWHWYLPLRIYITLKRFLIASVHSVFLYFF